MGRYKGRLISAIGPTTSNTKYTGSASGFWGLSEAVLYKANSLWPKGASVPDAPIISSVMGGDSSASVLFNAPADTGGTAITNYIAVSNPGNISGSGASSPIVVSGLTNSTTYTFTMTAYNSQGMSLPSANSSPVIIGYGAAPPALYTSGSAITSTSSSGTIPSFTAPNNSVIVIINGTETPGVNIATLSWGGLTFTRRTSVYNNPEAMDIWWAYNHTGADITTSGSISWGSPTTVDDQGLIYAVFTGCHQINPWVSSPTTGIGSGQLTVSWSRPNVYALVASGQWKHAAAGYPTGTGLSNIATAQNSGAVNWEWLYLSGGGQTAANGSITASFNTDTMVTYGDFLVA